MSVRLCCLVWTFAYSTTIIAPQRASIYASESFSYIKLSAVSFRLYDVDCDGKISKAELLQVFKASVESFPHKFTTAELK